MANPGLISDISMLTQIQRATLLEGPAFELVITCTGNLMTSEHQILAAGLRDTWYTDIETVRRDADNAAHQRSIALPISAMVAVSSHIRAFFAQQLSGRLSTVHRMHADLGSLLPYFAIEVLTWYLDALQSEQWTPCPRKYIGYQVDYWHMFYAYAAFRKLGMDEFADTFVPTLSKVMFSPQGLLVMEEGRDLAYLLPHLGTRDPLFLSVAKRYARWIRVDYNDEELFSLRAVVQIFPHFQRQVEWNMTRDGFVQDELDE
jgi:hypothetical protein